MERSILHMDLDTFFVSCERLQDSRLVGKPIMVGGSSDRAVVAGCSYEARAFGVHSGMSMKIARQLCPQGIVIRGDGSLYSQYSKLVTDIIDDAAPLYEKASIDEFYIDTTGMDRWIGTYNWAQELRNKIINETGLPISFGLASSKVVAKIGTGESKPNGFRKINWGDEKDFLAPLSIKKIPMIGEKTYQLLRSMGIARVKTLQEMPTEMMHRLMGKNGVTIWEKANGIDTTPVVPFHENKSISVERTFEQDTIDVHYLRSLIIAMAENLAYQLRHQQKLTSSVTIRIRYSDFQTVSKQVKISQTAADKILIDTALALFDALYTRRVLVRLIGVRFGDLVNGGFQINLFENTQKELNLLKAMDSIRNSFGAHAVKRAVTQEAIAFKPHRALYEHNKQSKD